MQLLLELLNWHKRQIAVEDQFHSVADTTERVVFMAS